MKIKKSITKAVIEANRKNATKSTGPRTEKGKNVVSGNAEKHALRSLYLRIKDEREKKAYRIMLRDLKCRIDVADPIQRIKAERAAINYVRWYRSLQLDQRFYDGHSPATTMAANAIQDPDFLDMNYFGAANSNPGWECHELSISTRKRRTKHNRRMAPWQSEVATTGRWSSTRNSRTWATFFFGTSAQYLGI